MCDNEEKDEMVMGRERGMKERIQEEKERVEREVKSILG